MNLLRVPIASALILAALFVLVGDVRAQPVTVKPRMLTLGHHAVELADGGAPADRGTMTTLPLPPQDEEVIAIDDFPPVDGVCDSWRPLFDRYQLPWETFEPIMWRESRCRNVQAHDHDDDSYGPLQTNRKGSMGPAWDSLGFDVGYMSTAEGAVHAAGLLFHRCGLGPWIRQYGCGFPHDTPTRWEWPGPS